MSLAMDVRCVTDSVRLYGATVQFVSVQQAKHSVIYCVILIWCCGSMSCGSRLAADWNNDERRAACRHVTTTQEPFNELTLQHFHRLVLRIVGISR